MQYITLEDIAKSKAKLNPAYTKMFRSDDDNYRIYPSMSIGESDIAAVIMAGPTEDGLKAEYLKFSKDGDYLAHIIDGNAKGYEGHYELIATLRNWLKFYDDEELVIGFKADEIKVYRAGEMGCIVQLIDKEEQKL